ncbi:hypothetical protein [Stenotrophomonas phage BUCT627]|uniref:Uncharacterized protein n=3 Tax=Bixiavirus TaxID=3044676 RepID=A0A7D2HG26_9CAUD|nr:hypothetical protein PQD75_gp027 [Stenotrophomonas phage vB_SmaS_BUCT548]YP_010677380.1 hypothetical protein PQD76_gp97 [Stenotrophomonas phage BUCT626]YP_010677462.1 hypothetical protein PQD77_gp097 [Stenotrophomonas phage BUCT627]WFG37973.1 hypothetical protein 20Sep420_00089 [Pseudomonas phage 20Sep420]QIQ60768.1 hypothetical protein [Stenotrophomonas phage vB_SmaS_BUCT548]QYC96662.1 hypothetical protein [Stenotrophomonas phage BUCT627]QYC96776.1 hypothetical protein [Stenotrophomonas p
MRFLNLDYHGDEVADITFNGKPVPASLVRMADDKTGELCFYVLDSQKRFQYDMTTRDAKVHTVQGVVTINIKAKP